MPTGRPVPYPYDRVAYVNTAQPERLMSVLTKIPVDAYAQEWVTRELERRRAASGVGAGPEAEPAPGGQGTLDQPLVPPPAGSPSAEGPRLA